MKLIDAHCHLDFDVFDDDREQVMSAAAQAGVEHIIIPATVQSRWRKIAALCKQHANLSACYGLHPYFVEQHDKRDIALLGDYATQHDCVAIGETGLDFRKGQADPEQQLFYFEAQLDIARQLGKPVVMHAVKATEKVIATLKRYPGVRGMAHSYSGSYEQARQLIDMGFYLSFGGAVTHERASRLREIVRKLPLSALLLETDAPDQSDASHTGERNQPAWLADILQNIAKLRNEPVELVAERTTHNARELFAL